MISHTIVTLSGTSVTIMTNVWTGQPECSFDSKQQQLFFFFSFSDGPSQFWLSPASDLKEPTTPSTEVNPSGTRI